MIFTLICFAIAVGFVFLDQITKAWAYATQVMQDDYFLGFIRFYYLKDGNNGISFGWFGGNTAAMIAITALTVVMIVAIAVLFFTVFKKNKPAQVALSVIEAGAVGNLIDRVVLGTVRDFVDVSPLGFGICNIADFCVTFGAIALVFIILFIGSHALFPLKERWRAQAKAEAAEEERKKKQAQDLAEDTQETDKNNE